MPAWDGFSVQASLDKKGVMAVPCDISLALVNMTKRNDPCIKSLGITTEQRFNTMHILCEPSNIQHIKTTLHLTLEYVIS